MSRARSDPLACGHDHIVHFGAECSVLGARCLGVEKLGVGSLNSRYNPPATWRRLVKPVTLLLAVAFAVVPATAGADTYPRQAGIDAQHYIFRLTLLTDDSNEIKGEATVRLRVVADGVREAVLDLTSATPDGKGMTVTAVSRADAPVAFVH